MTVPLGGVSWVPLMLPPFLHDTFGAGGYLARGKPNYQPRGPQIALAHAVARAFADARAAMLEGPCGTGKSYAYLVPAIEHAVRTGTRVIIATATNGLLDQLAMGHDCDLAVLQRTLPFKFRYASLKGRNNYVCAEKWDDFDPKLELTDRYGREGLKRLTVWAQDTVTGDKSECPPEAQRFWSQISCGPEECSRPNCDYVEACHAELARKAAAAAHVVVTNHTLLALELRHGPYVLPAFEKLIIDEAHEFPDVVRKTFGDRLGRSDIARIWGFSTKLESSGLIPAGTTQDAQEASDKLFSAAKKMLSNPIDTLLGKPIPEGRKLNLPSPMPFDVRAMRAAIGKVEEACGKILTETPPETKPDKNARKAQRWANRYARYLDMISSDENRSAIWLEGDHHGEPVLCAQPVDIGFILKDKLYGEHAGVCMLSATLSTAGTFDFFKREMGAPKDIDTLAVESPFDFKTQSLLLVPKGMPSPKTNEAQWEQQVRETLLKTVVACDGRTLGLFTSRKRAEEAARYLRQHDRSRTILVQGEAPPQQLALAFKRDERSVLVGTRTFWTGLDVPGDSLQAVVIDRLPVPSNEPLLDAMHARMGGAYFSQYLYPKGALLFKQGVGRGVRTINDICVIVVCDPRILSEAWGKIFLKSLPEMTTSERLEDIQPFLAYARQSLLARSSA